MSDRDIFVPCLWSCDRCHQSGELVAYQRSTETPAEAIARHQASTRSACLDGCLYLAKPAEPVEANQ